MTETFSGLVSIVNKYRAQSCWVPSKTPGLACFRIVPQEAKEASEFIHWLLYHWWRVAPTGIICPILLNWTYLWVEQPLLPWRTPSAEKQRGSVVQTWSATLAMALYNHSCTETKWGHRMSHMSNCYNHTCYMPQTRVPHGRKPQRETELSHS